MKQRHILIVDKDPKNLEILEKNFLNAQYQVEIATSDASALEKFKQQPFDVILSELISPGIDGFYILEQAQRESLSNQTPVIFLTTKSDIYHRVKCFRLGAKDFIVKPMHVKEIMARVNMVLTRMQRRKDATSFSAQRFAGRLEDLNLFDLIEVMGLEQKSGILRLDNENGLTGQVYFSNGHAINAHCGVLRVEDAIYKMLAWRKGRFAMVFCEIDVNDEISSSNLGILLQGAKRMETRDHLLEQLPSLSSVIVTSSNFKKITEQKDITPELRHFFNLFDGERTLGRIIDETREDEMVVLKRLVKLYQLGFLHILRDFDREPTGKTVTKEDPLRSLLDRFDANEEEDFEKIDESIPFNDESLFDVTAIEESKKITHHEPQNDGSPDQDLFSHHLENDPFYIFSQAARLEPKEVADEERPLSLPDEQSEADSYGSELFNPSTDILFNFYRASALETEMPELTIPKQSPESATEPIKPTAPAKKPSSPRLPELFRKAKGHILILSPFEDLREKTVRLLSGDNYTSGANQQDNLAPLYLGVAEFKGGHFLNLISFSTEKEFAPYLKYFSSKTMGYIILFQATQIRWDYFRYLITVLKDVLTVPGQVVFVKTGDFDKDTFFPEAKSRLNLDREDSLLMIEQFDAVSARRMIFKLFQKFYKTDAASERKAVDGEALFKDMKIPYHEGSK